MNVEIERLKAEANRASDHAAAFVLGLCEDGERAAVILAAARIDVLLEDMLKAVFHPCAGGQDDLFDADRPIASFSAKITVAFRLGLIDRDIERGIQLIRKIWNDFAHSHEPLDLSSGPSGNRLRELRKLCDKVEMTSKMENTLEERNLSRELIRFAACIAVILCRLDFTRLLAPRYMPKLSATLESTEG